MDIVRSWECGAVVPICGSTRLGSLLPKRVETLSYARCIIVNSVSAGSIWTPRTIAQFVYLLKGGKSKILPCEQLLLLYSNLTAYDGNLDLVQSRTPF